MLYKCHHIEKWTNANIDLVEEVLEKHQKAVIIIAGASSSGKSYSARILEQGLNYSGHKSVVISLDSYNVGLSGIIPNKVNVNYFDGKLPNMKEIINAIKSIIYNVDFDKKYSSSVLPKIRKAIQGYLSKQNLDKFMDALPKEWALLNFDEPTVYDMNEASMDVKELLKGNKIELKQYSKVVSERVETSTYLDGNDYDVLIVEGIYALTNYFLDGLVDVPTIKNFIDGNPKSLYLRRIIRDAQSTSASSAFTTKNYFKFIVPSYNEFILPSSNNADIIFDNDMTFQEMRCGELFDARLELKTSSKDAFEQLLKESEVSDIAYQKDSYFIVPGEDEKNMNTLRLRMISYDEGKTYVPYNLVHKGVKKVRRDNRIIRPINKLILKDDFSKIWSTQEECIDDFYRAGFIVGRVTHKVRYNVTYKKQKLKLSIIENKGYYVDFVEPVNEKIVDEIKNKFVKGK